jgi:CheY-like chemotaxis protein
MAMNARCNGPTHAACAAVWESPPVEKRVLVVDDDLHSREGLSASLQGEGYRVETAADSWQAIKKIKERRFDVAILDLDLPPVHGVTVSGWDLARIFRAYHPGISIIVISAEDRNAVRAEAERLRVSECFEKPVNLTQLKMILRTLQALSAGHSTGEYN